MQVHQLCGKQHFPMEERGILVLILHFPPCEAPSRIQGTFPLGEELRTGPWPLQLIGQRAGKGNVRDTRQKGGRQAS